MRFKSCRQDEIIRRPFPGAAGICRSSRDSDQRFFGEGVDRFASSVILNGEQTELFEIERAAVAGRLLRMTNLAGENNHQKCETTDHSRFQFVPYFIRDCRFRQTDPSFAKERLTVAPRCWLAPSGMFHALDLSRPEIAIRERTSCVLSKPVDTTAVIGLFCSVRSMVDRRLRFAGLWLETRFPRAGRS